MDQEDVGIATITLVRDAREEKLMRKALSALADLGMPVVAADGGSPASFTEFLRKVGIKVVTPRKRGLVPQVKLALSKAAAFSRRPCLLYTEPDKLLFFNGPILELIRRARMNARAPLVMAARDSDSFATFPQWQQFTETTINRITADLTGRRGDYCYGPLLFSAEDLELALDAPDDLGWGWRFHLLGRLHREGRSVRHVELPVPCPPQQRKESFTDRIYRTKQLRQNLNGLSSGAEV